MKKLVMRLEILLILMMGFSGLLAGSITPPTPVKAATVQWPTINLALINSDVTVPVSITHAGDHSGRIFVVEQSGTIQILLSGVKLPAPFLDIHTIISCCGERGLLGLAFPSNYASSGHFYVYYTNTSGEIVIARYTVSANRNLADANSAVIVLTIPHPTYSNHNGGQLAFGPDGYLYAGIGDGGSGGDPDNHGQSLNTLLGKVLRIDVEGNNCVLNPPRPQQNYCIPPNNPFISTSGAKPEIWALGLRNPWRFSFDRLTGDLYIGDVGQDAQEEIDFQPAASLGGANYGWRIREGNNCYLPSTGCSNPLNYIPPVAVYDHGVNDANGCSVTGGAVYRGPNVFINMQGVYFYADFCKGKIFGLKNDAGWQTKLLITAPFLISSFGEDEYGMIYVADYTTGAIYQLQAVINQAALPFRKYFPRISK